MNTVYKDLRDEFEADESYSGSEILSAILNAIKVCILNFVFQRKKNPVIVVYESLCIGISIMTCIK